MSRVERRLRKRRRRRGVLVMVLLLALVGAVVFQALQWSAARDVRAYLDELRPLLPGLRFELADERLSTVAAERALVGGGVRRRDRRQVVDQVAASVFLQTWLDRKR